MDQLNNYPWEIKPISEEDKAKLEKYQTGMPVDYVRVGPYGYLLLSDFVTTGLEIYDLKLRPTDVFVATFPKSGTTWTQELVWLIGNNFDYKRAAEENLDKRFPFIEFMPMYNQLKSGHFSTENSPKESEAAKNSENVSVSVTDFFDKAPSPRFIKTHLSMSLLPPKILDIAKVVYVARDPRDVAVSFYHHYKLFKMTNFTGDFKIYWKLFKEGLISFGPYFPHVKEAWEKRNHPNMLFLFYEELSKDLPAVVRRVAQFLEKPITEEQVRRLCDHLHIDNFRQNKSVNLDHMKQMGILNDQKSSFIRKGKTGGWRSYFDEEMTAQAEQWIEENLHGTDLSFPQ